MVGAIGVRVEIDHPRRFGIIDAIKQQQLSRAAVFGKPAEIGAAAAERRAKREASARCSMTLMGMGERIFIQIPCLSSKAHSCSRRRYGR
jgi:hypothetical protein